MACTDRRQLKETESEGTDSWSTLMCTFLFDLVLGHRGISVIEHITHGLAA
jgi:hypothetical protein